MKNILFLVMVFFINSLFLDSMTTSLKGKKNVSQFKRLTSDENGVSVSVELLHYKKEEEIHFDISMDTHDGSLDYDLSQLALLEDDLGNHYSPKVWFGPFGGGHHITGALIFGPVDPQSKSLKLIISNIRDVKSRIFYWDLYK